MGPSSIPVCIRHNITSINITNGSVLLRCSPSICRLLSLGVNGYEVTITTGHNFHCDGRGALGITAGFIGVTRGCCSRGKHSVSVVHLGNSVRVTPVLKLSSIVISVIRANAALGRGGLRIVRAMMPVDTHLVTGGASFGFGDRRVRTLGARLRLRIRRTG